VSRRIWSVDTGEISFRLGFLSFPLHHVWKLLGNGGGVPTRAGQGDVVALDDAVTSETTKNDARSAGAVTDGEQTIVGTDEEMDDGG
jgi:hypothetical protein